MSCVACSKGEKLYPVEGKVMLKDAPLKGALVTFHPTTPSEELKDLPVGFTADDGTFKLTTGQADGAAAGSYTVTIIAPEQPKPPAPGKGFSTGEDEPEDRLKGSYSNPTQSKITAEVKEGANQLEPFVLP
jgi:hypothetical protein